MNDATLQYVRQHAHDDVRMLALRGSKDPEVDLQTALFQIKGRQTALRKLPSWASCDSIVFPPHLNMEQCSSEQTAKYKAGVCSRVVRSGTAEGTSLVDLTGGFGVDFTLMSTVFGRATYVERDPQLCAISSGNYRQMVDTVKSVNFVNADAADYLSTVGHATMIFLDPARRDDHGGRTYALADCTPDVLQLRDELLRRADYVLLKLSPMLDWRKAVNDLGTQQVREVHIVAVDGECKELLLLLSNKGESLTLHCVNDDDAFVVSPSQPAIPCVCKQPQDGGFLYEPNAAIMKSGCFDQLAQAFGVYPIAPNSHLFLSDEPKNDFPGRMFRITTVTTMNRRELKQALGSLRQANISVRNFPLSVEQLRRRLHLSDGGDTYLFATTQADGTHVLLVCSKELQLI